MEEFIEIGTFFELSEKHDSQLVSVLLISYFCHKFSIHKERVWYEKFLKLFDLPNYSQVKRQIENLSIQDKKYLILFISF